MTNRHVILHPSGQSFDSQEGCCAVCGRALDDSGRVACYKCGRIVGACCWRYDKQRQRYYCPVCYKIEQVITDVKSKR